jgi:hypothetical protein
MLMKLFDVFSKNRIRKRPNERLRHPHPFEQFECRELLSAYTFVPIAGPFEAYTAEPTLNNSGLVAFAEGNGGAKDNRFVVTGDGQTLNTVASTDSDALAYSMPVISDNGIVAFAAGGTGCGEGIYTASGWPSTPLVGSASSFTCILHLIDINDAGTVAFSGSPQDSPSGSFSSGIFASDGRRIFQDFSSVLSEPAINDAGSVAFALTGFYGTAIVVGNGGAPRRIAGISSYSAPAFNCLCGSLGPSVFEGDPNEPPNNQDEPVEARVEVTLRADEFHEKDPFGQPIYRLDYETEDGSATAGDHYTAQRGTLEFKPGEITQTVTIPIISDDVGGPDRTFKVVFRNLVAVNDHYLELRTDPSLILWEANVTILNDDFDDPPPPILSAVGDYVLEGDSDVPDAVFQLSLSRLPENAQQVTVHYETADGSAHAGDDYGARSGSLVFDSDHLAYEVRVPIKDDSLVEGADPPDRNWRHESFHLELSTAGDILVDSSAAQTWIRDDDRFAIHPGQPALNNSGVVAFWAESTSDARLESESSGGTHEFDGIYTVDSLGGVPVLRVDTRGGFETLGQKVRINDSGEIAFFAVTNDRREGIFTGPDSVADKVVAVGDLVCGREVTRVYDTFDLNDHGQLAIVVGFGSLLIDQNVYRADPGMALGDTECNTQEPRVVIDDVRFPERNFGTSSWTFTVSLSAPSTVPVTVDFATVNGTAIGGQDYHEVHGSLNFPPGTTSQSIVVPVLGDRTIEKDETFFVNLAVSTNATIADGQATGTIQNDDLRRPTVLRAQRNLLTYGEHAIRLVGYGDLGSLAEQQFDYQAYLSELDSRGINFCRIWLSYLWANDGSPFQLQSDGKYDLGHFNDSYFTRLQEFVSLAEQHNTIVQLTLFNGTELIGSRWMRSPYHPDNNSNGFISSTPEFATSAALYQGSHLPLVRRVAAALRDFPNVIYEIANEPVSHEMGGQGGIAFHSKISRDLGAALKRGLGSKVVSVNIPDDTTDRFTRWAVQRAKLLSIHVVTGESDSSMNTGYQVLNHFSKLTKPIIVSNDGDITQMTVGQCLARTDYDCTQLPDDTARRDRTYALLHAAFAANRPVGQVHIDFLDKGLNGDSWRPNSLDYEPRWDTDHYSASILDLLSDYVRA